MVTAVDNLHWDFFNRQHVQESIELISSVFNIDARIIADWFQKRMLDNPFQHGVRGFGVGAWAGSQLIAEYGVLGQPWWLEGKEIIAGFGTNWVVRSEYQGKGLGNELGRRALACAPIIGATWTGIQTQGMMKKAGYLPLASGNDSFRTRVSFRESLVKRLGKLIGGAAGFVFDLSLLLREIRWAGSHRFRFELVDRCDGRFDDLWESARNGYRSCLVRTSAYLNWRVFDASTCPLHLASLSDQDGRLRALSVWHVQSFDENVRMAVLRDLFGAPNDETALRTLLVETIGHWRREGISWANLEVAHPVVTALFQQLGMEALGSRGCRYLFHPCRSISEEAWRTWFRSGLDGDYYDLNRQGMS
jgi:hypothetical protein